MKSATLLRLSAALAAALASATAAESPARADEPPSPAPAPPPAAAAPLDDTARAEALYTEAKAALQEGKLDLAYEKLSAAWAIRRGYDIAANLGNVEVALKKYRDAAEHLSFSIETFPLKGDPETKKALSEKLEQAKGEIGSVTVKVNVDGSVVTLDGKGLGSAPLKGVQFVEPGHRVFGATRDGYEPARMEVDVTKGGVMDVALELKPKAVPTSAGWAVGAVGFGIAGVGILSGIVLTVLANGKSADTAALSADLHATGTRCPVGSPLDRCTEFRDTVTSADHLSNAAVAMWVVGGVGVVTGLAGVIAGAVQSRPSETVLILPAIGPGLAGATLSSTF